MASAHHNTVVFNDIKQPMAFDTPLFSGTALLLLRNMPTTPKGVFEGKRRQMVLTVQVGLHLAVLASVCFCFHSCFSAHIL
jgi:hypothetical protein